MKKGAAVLLALAGLNLPGGAVAADYSANIGWTSDYIFRGIPQKESSASFGLDVEHKGGYAGTWAADVGQGVEVDVYFGYGAEFRDIAYSIGATGYFYTDGFDDTYREINLGTEWKFLSLDVALGRYDNFSGPTLDYTFASLTAEHAGFHGTIGSFGNDFDGDYLELGYGLEIATVDVTVSWVHGSSTLPGSASDNTILLTVGKSISFSE